MRASDIPEFTFVGRPSAAVLTVRILLAATSLLLSVPALASELPSIVVVDALSLPSHLNDFHARARAAISKVAEDKGWGTVDAGQSSCRDAACAAELARSAGTTNALIAGGTYRTGGYDLWVRFWNGQEMVVDQAACEDCTGPEFVNRLGAMVGLLVPAGKAPVNPLLKPVPAPRVAAVPLVPQTPPPTEERASRRYLMPIGWTLVAGGLALAAGGAYLLGTDGRLEHCVDTSAGTTACSRLREAHGGLILVIGGSAATALGAGLLMYGHHLKVTRQWAIAAGPGSLMLSGRF